MVALPSQHFQLPLVISSNRGDKIREAALSGKKFVDPR